VIAEMKWLIIDLCAAELEPLWEILHHLISSLIRYFEIKGINNGNNEVKDEMT